MNFLDELGEGIDKINVTLEKDNIKIKNIYNNLINLEEKLTSAMNIGVDILTSKCIKSSEVVLKDKQIIDQHLYNLNDKINYEIILKNFYTFCDDKINSQKNLLKKDKINELFMIKEDGVFRFMIFGEEIKLCVYSRLISTESYYQIIRWNFLKYAPNIESLCMVIIHPCCYEIFRGLECFYNVKTIKIDVLSLQRNGNNIFKTCPSLKPINLHIKEFTSKIDNVIDSQNFQFPPFIKNIIFESDPNSLRWLLDRLKFHQKRQFESFYIYYSNFSRLITFDDKNVFLNIISCFKEVNYFTDDFILNEMDRWFVKIVSILNIKLNITIYFSQNSFDKNILECPGIIDDFNLNRWEFLKNPCNRFLSQSNVYLNIKKLSISDFYNTRKHLSFSSYEIKILIDDISLMYFLEQLEIDLHLFNTFPEFKYFCNCIRSKLKYLKIGRCSTIMTYHLPVIANNCHNLKYLCLEEVGPYTNVTINEVLKYLTNLKCLKIIFSDFYNVKYIFDNLTKKIDGKRINVLEWPNINFLEVHFSTTDQDYQMILLEIQKNTPDIEGKLLINYEYANKRTYCKIVIQRYGTILNELKEIFNF